MKSITLTFEPPVTKTFDVSKCSKKWQKYLNILEKDEEDFTDEDWDMYDNYSLTDFLRENGYPEIHDYTEIDIETYK